MAMTQSTTKSFGYNSQASPCFKKGNRRNSPIIGTESESKNKHFFTLSFHGSTLKITFSQKHHKADLPDWPTTFVFIIDNLNFTNRVHSRNPLNPFKNLHQPMRFFLPFLALLLTFQSVTAQNLSSPLTTW